MFEKLRSGVIAVAAGLTALPGAAAFAVADDEDVPKRAPSLLWEVAVDCDGAAPTPSSDGTARLCNVDVDGESVYVHEHTAGVTGSGATSRLSSFDIASGDQRWVHDVGATEQLDVYRDAVVLRDKAHVEVYDPETGALRFTLDGQLAHVNRYITLLMADEQAVTAFDPDSGSELWSSDGRLITVCRDIVVIVPPAGNTTERRFSVLDHRTGEERWGSSEPFDPRTDEIVCGNEPFFYTSDGDRLTERSTHDGWLHWSTPIDNARAIEIYREVVLVQSGAAGETTVAVDRRTGEVQWQLPTAQVGRPVSIVGRLRADLTGVFVMHPLSGEIVTHVEAATPDATFRIVGVSDTRLVVATGSMITTYGFNDLGASWQLDAGEEPDDVRVASGYLVVRIGGTLRGYG